MKRYCTPKILVHQMKMGGMVCVSDTKSLRWYQDEANYVESEENLL